LLGLSRSTARYETRPKEDEARLVERLQEFVHKRRRRGYRLIHQELRASGMVINHKRVYRLWKREGLTVPPRRGRRRIRGTALGGTAPPRAITAHCPDQVWCVDFLEERTLAGHKLRILCVSDEFTRESLDIAVGRSFRSQSVCEVIEAVMSRRGVPGALRMDNGPEFIALALRGLCYRHGISSCYIDPGKPWQNGFAESFHARLRDEYLDGEVFLSVREAQVRLDSWRRDWNEERLHSSLDYVTPLEFAARYNVARYNQDQDTENTANTKDVTGS
jgi:transposase InsO family protein